MTARKPLPAHLAPSFRVGDALSSGVSRKRLQAGDLRRAVHGTRSTTDDRRLALVAVMAPDQAFAGPTAAAIWSLPLPHRFASDARLHVCSFGPNQMRRLGVVSSRRTTMRRVLRDGVPVLDPVCTWLSLGPLLPPWDLTCVADRLVSGTLRTPPLVSLRDLCRGMDDAGRIPGIRSLRAALVDTRAGSWSRPETLLRLLLVRAGLPEPTLNAPVVLLDGGLVSPDLAWPEYRVVIEYDGRWHDEPGQRAADSERHERLVDAGWLVVRVRSDDLFDRASAVVARIVSRLGERGFALARSVQWAKMPRFER